MLKKPANSRQFKSKLVVSKIYCYSVTKISDLKLNIASLIEHFPLTWRTFFITLNVFSDGPCLVHTLNGDLLRSLDPPGDTQMTANLICMSRETFVMIKFDSGDICNFSVNGRLQKHVKHKDNVQVSLDKKYITGFRVLIIICRTFGEHGQLE